MSLSIESLSQIDPTDLVVNILACAEHITKCTNENANHCRIEMFCGFSVEALKIKWKTEWGVFDQVICKLLKADKDFTDDLNDSFPGKHLIADFLKKIQ